MGVDVSHFSGHSAVFTKSYKGNSKESIKALWYYSFVLGIHWSRLVSPHKVPVMWKAYECRDAIMNYMEKSA